MGEVTGSRRTCRVVLLLLALASSGPSIVHAQTAWDILFVPRVGVVTRQADLGRVDIGEQGYFEAEGVAPTTLVGLTVRQARVSGWELEATLLRTLSGSASSTHGCVEACLAIFETPTLSVWSTSLVLTASPPVAVGPLRAKVGAGVERYVTRWEGGTNFGRGKASDTRPSLFLGILSRWRLSDSVLEIQGTVIGNRAVGEDGGVLSTSVVLDFGVGIPVG